jgi:hypothetical protein
MSDPKKLSHEALLEWIDRLAVSWLRSRKPEFLVAWKQFDICVPIRFDQAAASTYERL